jgi:hypothetical protein
MANPAKTSCEIVGIGNDYSDPVSNPLPVATSAAAAIGGLSAGMIGARGPNLVLCRDGFALPA